MGLFNKALELTRGGGANDADNRHPWCSVKWKEPDCHYSHFNSYSLVRKLLPASTATAHQIAQYNDTSCFLDVLTMNQCYNTVNVKTHITDSTCTDLSGYFGNLAIISQVHKGHWKNWKNFLFLVTWSMTQNSSSSKCVWLTQHEASHKGLLFSCFTV